MCWLSPRPEHWQFEEQVIELRKMLGSLVNRVNEQPFANKH